MVSRAGVGFVTSQDGEVQPKSSTSTDMLRRQILGKRGREGRAGTGLERVRGGLKMTAPLRKGISRPAKEDDEESEEEEGRSGLGKKRRDVQHQARSSVIGEGDTKGCGLTEPAPSNGNSLVKQPQANYLDEVLAQRSKKKKNKKRQVDTKDPEVLTPTG